MMKMIITDYKPHNTYAFMLFPYFISDYLNGKRKLVDIAAYLGVSEVTLNNWYDVYRSVGVETYKRCLEEAKRIHAQKYGYTYLSEQERKDLGSKIFLIKEFEQKYDKIFNLHLLNNDQINKLANLIIEHENKAQIEDIFNQSTATA